MSGEKSLPVTMQAVFFDKPGGRLFVKDVKIPVPGPGEVLVRMSAAPINPSDLARIKNASGESDMDTFIPGLEGSGLVVAAGKGILPHLWLGKKVACSAEYHTSGTWAEYMVTRAGSCFPLASGVSDDQGSMSLVNPLTAIGFFEIARQYNHRAIINNAAASALGRMVELLGNKHRIPVINIVRNQKQLEKLRQSGSRYVLDSSDAGFIRDLGTLSHDLGANLLLDSVCSSQLGEMCDVLPANSRIIIYGNLSGEEHIHFKPRTLISNNLTISGFYLGSRARENGLIKNMMNLRQVGSLMRSDLTISIQGRFPLSQAQKAVETYLADMSAGKVLLVMTV